MAEFNMSACVAACASLQPCLDTCYVYNGWLAPPSLSQTIAFSVAGGAGVGVAALVACVMASTLALDLPSLQVSLAAGAPFPLHFCPAAGAPPCLFLPAPFPTHSPLRASLCAPLSAPPHVQALAASADKAERRKVRPIRPRCSFRFLVPPITSLIVPHWPLLLALLLGMHVPVSYPVTPLSHHLSTALAPLTPRPAGPMDGWMAGEGGAAGAAMSAPLPGAAGNAALGCMASHTHRTARGRIPPITACLSLLCSLPFFPTGLCGHGMAGRAEVLGVWWGWLCAFSLLFLAVELLPPALCTNRSLQVAGATAWVGGVAVVALFPLAWPVGLLLDCLVSRSALSPAHDDGPVKCRLAPDPLQQGEQEQEQEGEGDACKPFAARAGKGGCEEEWSDEEEWGGGKEWKTREEEGEVGGGGWEEEERDGGGDKEACRRGARGPEGGGQQGEGGVSLYGGSVMESGGGEGSSEGAAVQMAVLPSSSHAAMPPPPPLSHAHATQHAASSHPTLASNPLPPTCHTPPAGSPHAPQSPLAPPPWFLQSWEHAAVWARLAAVPPTPAAPTSHPHPADAARALDPPDSSVRAGSGGGRAHVAAVRDYHATPSAAPSTAPPAATLPGGVPPLPLSSSTPLWRHRPPLPAAAASSSGQPMPPTDSSASADALRPPH
ncbi:unnamed protein product [Closterium sp. Naga37s-1]|nr:unnamed protein product [Closterium sp. Naga37s-1]